MRKLREEPLFLNESESSAERSVHMNKHLIGYFQGCLQTIYKTPFRAG